MKTIEHNEDGKLCEACGGRCCKGLPGTLYPSDLNAQTLKQDVIARLSSGLYALDYWVSDEDIYFMRPATKGQEGEVVDPSWGGECTFLDNNGCRLAFDDRPRGCRALIPAPQEESCDAQGHDRWHGAEAWLPYQAMLREVINETTQSS